MAGSLQSYQMFGSYLGIGLVILYIGRRSYMTVLARAFGLKAADEAEPQAVWACRFALAAAAAMVLILVIAVRLDWMLAILLVLMLGLLFTVLTRINVETGLFMIQPGWQAAGVLLGLFRLRGHRASHVHHSRHPLPRLCGRPDRLSHAAGRQCAEDRAGA